MTARGRSALGGRRALGATQTREPELEGDDEDINPAHKKRRTSSVEPENRVSEHHADTDEDAVYDPQVEERMLLGGAGFEVEAKNETEGFGSVEAETGWDDRASCLLRLFLLRNISYLSNCYINMCYPTLSTCAT